MKVNMWDSVTPGTPIYAIDDTQRVIRGTFQKRLPDGTAEMLDEDGNVRTFPLRYCQLDTWRALESL